MSKTKTSRALEKATKITKKKSKAYLKFKEEFNLLPIWKKHLNKILLDNYRYEYIEAVERELELRRKINE